MRKWNALLAVLCAALLFGCLRGGYPEPDEEAAKKAGVVTLTDETFDEKVLDSEQLVMVDFWATWCGPCLEMFPVVVEIAREYKGRAVIAKLDIDENELIPSRYEIQAIPAILFFRNGEIVYEHAGSTSKEQLASIIDSLLAEEDTTASAR